MFHRRMFSQILQKNFGTRDRIALLLKRLGGISILLFLICFGTIFVLLTTFSNHLKKAGSFQNISLDFLMSLYFVKPLTVLGCLFIILSTILYLSSLFPMKDRKRGGPKVKSFAGIVAIIGGLMLLLRRRLFSIPIDPVYLIFEILGGVSIGVGILILLGFIRND